MPLSVTRKNRVCALVYGLLLVLCHPALAQSGHHVIIDSLPKLSGRPAARPAFVNPGAGNRLSAGNTCNTNTFYLQLPAAAGEQVSLSRVQTFPDGNYLAAGTATLPGNTPEALLMLLGKDGSILKQQRYRIAALPSLLTDAAIAINGACYITGLIADGSNRIFLASIKEDLSVAWSKTITQAGVPASPKLAALDDLSISLAVQVQGDIACGLYNSNGQPVWQTNLKPAGISNLVGINRISYGTIGVVSNCTSNGLQMVQLYELNIINGNLNNTSFKGDGITENKAMAVSNFAGRMDILGVTGSAGGFRDIFYSPPSSETVHQFSPATLPDFSATAAMDNAADAMGYFLPALQQLILIKQFAYYTTAPEFAKKYTIPGGSAIAGITRSFDGGFLFGLNTVGANAVILMKTDSLGLLPGCGEETMDITATEATRVTNTLTGASQNGASAPVTDLALQTLPAGYSGQFSCRQNSCPPEPVADTCLSTYYKAFRSGSYIDLGNRYFLLQNNQQLLTTVRYDRVVGSGNQLTYGLKLLDEKGALVKAADVYNDTATQTFTGWKMDDRQIMLVAYSPINGQQRFNFTLVNDQLQKQWSKSIITGFDFYSSGIGVSDVHEDQEGNFYVIATRSGFSPVKSAVFIYKMSAAGNTLWTSAYESTHDFAGTASITSTASSVVIVIEGSQDGNISLQLNKQNGQLQNSYRFNNSWAGSVYTRMLRYTEGRVLYAGSDLSGNFLMGAFDTTGKPLRLRYADAPASTMRAAEVKNGKLYASYNYYDGTGFKDVLLKADTALNLEFIRQYDRYSHSQGIGVSDAGNIYSSSIHFYGGANGSYADNFIIKYGPQGELGTCNSSIPDTRFIDVVPVIADAGMTPLTRSYPEDPFTITLLPSDALLNVSDILCSSTPQCSFIKLQDPGAVCRLDTVYTLHYSKDLNCILRPQLGFDTSFMTVRGITDSTILFKLKKTGSSWLKAGLNAGCQVYKDSVLLRANAATAALSLGADTLLCTGDSLVLHAGAGYSQYLWQDGSTDSLFTVSHAGKYLVAVTNACGEKASDTINIAAAIVPVLNLGPDAALCLRDTMRLQATAGFASYQWQPAALVSGAGSSVQVTAPVDTAFRLAAITPDGCVARDTIRIHVISARPVNLGADTSFCATDSIRLNAGSGYLAYHWSNGSILPSITIHQPGNYWVRVTDTNGCSAGDTLLVLQTFANPVIALGPDRDICTGEQLVLDAGLYHSYLWNDGSQSRIKTVTAAGSYSVTVTDNHNCRGADSISILRLNPLPAAFLRTTDSLCSYGKLTIVPEKTYRSYQWSNGSTQSVITISKAGLYTLEVTDTNGCKGTDSIFIVKKECMSGFYVPSAFSPNGDRVNDLFHPLAFGPLLHFTFQVYNRFGQQVFYSTNPDQAWDGRFQGKPCDVGGYIWQCHYQFEGAQPAYEKGSVMLIR